MFRWALSCIFWLQKLGNPRPYPPYPLGGSYPQYPPRQSFEYPYYQQQQISFCLVLLKFLEWAFFDWNFWKQWLKRLFIAWWHPDILLAKYLDMLVVWNKDKAALQLRNSWTKTPNFQSFSWSIFVLRCLEHRWIQKFSLVFWLETLVAFYKELE